MNGISFTVEPGETVAIVGGSGTGKSTILNLMLRFFDPWEGRILFDGQDIRSFKLKSLRSQISVVLQESILFRRTVRENIAYGKPQATLDEIVDAAKAAEAHDFIEPCQRDMTRCSTSRAVICLVVSVRGWRLREHSCGILQFWSWMSRRQGWMQSLSRNSRKRSKNLRAGERRSSSLTDFRPSIRRIASWCSAAGASHSRAPIRS